MYRKIYRNEINIHIENLEKDGYSVVKNYLNKSFSNKINSTINNLYDELKNNKIKPPKGYQSMILKDPIIQNPFLYNLEILNLASTGDALKIYSHFLNDPYYGLIPKEEVNFILAQATLRKGSEPLPLHYDRRLQINSSKTWSMQGILAINKRKSSNGGLVVLPGSHKFEKPPSEIKNTTNKINVDLNQGDFVIFNSSLFHATTGIEENQEPSWGYLLTYRSWWCKQQFDIAHMIKKIKNLNLTDFQKTLFGLYSEPSKDPNGSASAREGYSK